MIQLIVKIYFMAMRLLTSSGGTTMRVVKRIKVELPLFRNRIQVMDPDGKWHKLKLNYRPRIVAEMHIKECPGPFERVRQVAWDDLPDELARLGFTDIDELLKKLGWQKQGGES